MDNQQTKELLKGMNNEGFEIKIPFSKASFHQAKIESIIKSFKVCLKAAQLLGAFLLTIVTFIIVIRRCAALLNPKPIIILQPTLAYPDEILSVSPSSPTGPVSSTWWSPSAARHYAGQQALIQAHLSRFKSQWKAHYTNRLYSNSNMATCSALELNDVVLITDLASNSTRGIHPGLGRIIGFLDPDKKSQAIVIYSNSQVDRPISRLVRIVKANEITPAKGKSSCPLAEVDEQVQESHEDPEEGPPGPVDLDAAASHQDEDQQHPPVLPSPPEELLPQTVEDLPVDAVEEPTPPPEEVVERAAQRPVPVSWGGQDTGSPQISETDPGQGMRQTHTDRPTRIRKKLSKFST